MFFKVILNMISQQRMLIKQKRSNILPKEQYVIDICESRFFGGGGREAKQCLLKGEQKILKIF